MIREPPVSTLVAFTTLVLSGVGAHRRDRRPADGGEQPRPLDGTLPHRRAPGGWHDAQLRRARVVTRFAPWSRCTEEGADRKSTHLNSSHANISYAVFCLKKI